MAAETKRGGRAVTRESTEKVKGHRIEQTDRLRDAKKQNQVDDERGVQAWPLTGIDWFLMVSWLKFWEGQWKRASSRAPSLLSLHEYLMQCPSELAK